LSNIFSSRHFFVASDLPDPISRGGRQVGIQQGAPSCPLRVDPEGGDVMENREPDGNLRHFGLSRTPSKRPSAWQRRSLPTSRQRRRRCSGSCIVLFYSIIIVVRHTWRTRMPNLANSNAKFGELECQIWRTRLPDLANLNAAGAGVRRLYFPGGKASGVVWLFERMQFLSNPLPRADTHHCQPDTARAAKPAILPEPAAGYPDP